MIPHAYAPFAGNMIIIITEGHSVKSFFDKKDKKDLEILCDL